MGEDEKKAIRQDFEAAVNMAPKELEQWLETEESKSVGWTREGEDEAVGHQSGRRIVEIKRKAKDAYSDEDYDHMKKVIGYVNRHIKQGPKGDPRGSKWRFSLMNWGHDPLKD